MVRYEGDAVLPSGITPFYRLLRSFVGMRREGVFSVCRRLSAGTGGNVVVRRQAAGIRSADRTGGMVWGELNGKSGLTIRHGEEIQKAVSGHTGNHGSGFFPDVVFQQFSLGYDAGRTSERIFLFFLPDNGSGGSLFLCTEDADARAAGVSGSAKRNSGAGLPEGI